MSSAQLLTLTGEASRRSATADQLPRAVVKIAMRRCLPLLVLLAVHLGASVLVTNAKDKQMQLPKMLKLDEDVRAAMVRASTHVVDIDDN